MQAVLVEVTFVKLTFSKERIEKVPAKETLRNDHMGFCGSDAWW